MRDWLEPIVGETGAVVAQFLITLVIVLALVLIVWWLVRRFWPTRLGGIGRGRVPRLAIVDAMAVDGRRKLVLIRRDNVEHLILIGGPADIVVEPSIQRPRRPLQQPQAPQKAPLPQPTEAFSVTAPPPAPPPPPTPPWRPETVAAPEPVPFPPRSLSTPALATDDPHESAREFAPPSRFDAEPRYATETFATAAVDQVRIDGADQDVQFAGGERADEVESAAGQQAETAPEQPGMSQPAHAEDRYPPPETDDAAQMQVDFGEEAAPATATEDVAEPIESPDAKPARVTDLEREMARLLGEITSKRPL